MPPETKVAKTAVFGPYLLDFRSGELRKHGIPLKIGEQPLQILMLLVQREGELVVREELQTKLWSTDTFVDFDHSLNSAVQRLRDCLSDSAGKARWIETVPRRGYRFQGKVEWSPGVAAATISNNTNGNAHNLPTNSQIVTSASTTELPSSPRRTWRRFLWPIMAGSLALVAIASVWTLHSSSLPLRNVQTRQITNDGLEKIGVMATDGIRVYFSEKVNGHWTIAAAAISGGSVEPIRIPFHDATLVNISPDRSELLVAEGSSQEHPLWAISILGGTPRRIGTTLAHSASWSPDGTKFAYATGGELFVARPDGIEPRRLVPPDNITDVWVWTPVWSPDGKRLRFERYNMATHASALWEITAEGQNLHRVLPYSESAPMQCCGMWTADQRYYVFDAWKDLEAGPPTAPASNLWAMRETQHLLTRKTELFQLTSGPVHFFTHVLSADGKVIFALSTQRRGELSRYDAATKQFSPFLAGISADNISLSRDGAWVAYVKYPQGELWRSRADGSDPLQLGFHPLMAFGPHWSPDGKRIAFTAQSAGTKFRPYVVSADGSTKPKAQTSAGADPTWSPDGKLLLFENLESPQPTMQLLDLQTRVVSTVPGSEAIQSPRWSPDGQHISAIKYVQGETDRLMLFDFKTQAWTQQGQTHAALQNWSGDGKYVYFLNDDDKPGIFRISVANNKLTKVMDLKDFRAADPDGGWFSLGPHDEPLLLRDTGGGTEVYALQWDAP